MTVHFQRHQRIGDILRDCHQVSDFPGDDRRACRGEEPAAHNEAHQTLRNQLSDHRQAEAGNHQFTDRLQRVAQNQPVDRDDTGVAGELRP